MQHNALQYISRMIVAALCLVAAHGCYKDKGNYSYKPLPAVATIDTNSYQMSYQKVFIQDSLIIHPVVYYAGDTNDLSYEWQIWSIMQGKFITLQKGKDLAYQCGQDAFVPGAGSYNLRLAITDKKLGSDSSSPLANRLFSRVISLTVVTSNHRGLMVLHGDGQQCDVGMIESNFFLPKAGQTMTTLVTPHFYSYYNNGEMIPGVGRQVEKIGYVYIFGSFVYGTADVYIFTDKTNIRSSYLTMQKEGDYSALFALPSYASGNPQHYTQVGTSQFETLVDDGRVFYGSFAGQLFNDNFSYYAAPYVSLVASFSPSLGVVAFDTISKSFLWSGYGSGTTTINQFPNSTMSGVNLQPNNMQARLVYMDSRGRGYNTLAVMQDAATGNKYLAEFNFAAQDLSQVSVGRYPMEGLPDQDKIKYYAFGRELNEVYYATDNKIYQYLYQGSNTANALYTFPAGEQITVMKMIKYEYQATSTDYQFSNRQLVVATVDGQGNGKVYAFAVNTVTGAITLNSTYDGFGTIYDLSIKTQ